MARSPNLIRVGIVGLNATRGWAAQSHVPALRAVAGYELRAACASTPASAAAAAEAHDVPVACADLEELVEREDVDLIVVTTRVPDHFRPVASALEAGKAVFCEWPLGNGLAEALKLAELARTRGLRTAIGLQARSAPPIRYVADLVSEGYVGEVLSTTLIGSGMAWGGEVAEPQGRYLVDRTNGATMLTITVGHALDALAAIFGEPEQLRPTLATRRDHVLDRKNGELIAMTAADQVALTGRLGNGGVFALHYRGGISRGTNLHWEINGSEGDLLLTSPNGQLQFGQLSIQGARGETTELEPLPLPDSYESLKEFASGPQVPAIAVAHAYLRLRDEFDLSGTGQVPDFDHAVRRHETIDAIIHGSDCGL